MLIHQTTDKERKDWEVPTLEELFKNVRDLNERFDISMINMETKPQWLKDAIKRWNSELTTDNVANAQQQL